MGRNHWIAMRLGRQVPPSDQSSPPLWQRNLALRQLWLSGLHLSPRILPNYVQVLRRAGIRFLEGYPSTLFVLARFLLDRGETVPLQVVFSSSETLLEMQRETIKQAVQAPLFDFYGHAERTVFAIECRQHAGKYLVQPFGISEIVDANGEAVPDGQFGFIVGTSLFNTTMPLVRYRTGDISAIDPAPCPCGSGFRRIVGVSTKAEDIDVLPDGRWLSPSTLTYPFKPYPQIVESQVVQESVSLVRVNLVATLLFSQQHESELLRALRARLSPGVQVEIPRVDAIPRERSGKVRWVISRVRHLLTIDWASAPTG